MEDFLTLLGSSHSSLINVTDLCEVYKERNQEKISNLKLFQYISDFLKELVELTFERPIWCLVKFADVLVQWCH